MFAVDGWKSPSLLGQKFSESPCPVSNRTLYFKVLFRTRNFQTLRLSHEVTRVKAQTGHKDLSHDIAKRNIGLMRQNKQPQTQKETSKIVYPVCSEQRALINQICPGLKANKIQIPYDKHHIVSSLVKTHLNTHNFVKYKVI